MLLTSLLFLFASLAAVARCSDYREQLLLRPLPKGALLASFNFQSNTSAQAFDQQNFRYFPRSLGQILQHAHTKELHLRFSLGRWDDESWGARPRNGAREGGTGVELWAWVDAATDEEANARWLTLANALSGLFCASLNFIDSTKTIRPVKTFEPEGTHPPDSLVNLHLLHGTLPHEVVCTENLTPFVKLLPCKGKAGISSLFDGHKLFDASWQTMAIDVRPVCPSESGECVLEIEQTVDMVLNLERSKRPRDNPIPRPPKLSEIHCDESKPYNSHDSCMPLDKSAAPAWSLQQVFGRPIKGSCPLSDEHDAQQVVCVHAPLERAFDIRAGEARPEVKQFGPDVRCMPLPSGASEGADFDLDFPEQELASSLNLTQPPLHASRGITGYGQERGGIEAVLSNPSTHSVSLLYLESLPWFMKPYLHTLKAVVTDFTGSNRNIKALKETYYRPAIDRERGTHLELLLEIPPLSTLTLSYDFEKAILRYTEYPPDANRGFDAAPAVIRVLPGAGSAAGLERQQKGIYLRTTSILLPLPTPDFSMPYNVIILTSTVMALGFGSIFNLLHRRFVGADEVQEGKLRGLVTRAGDGIRGRLKGRFLAKKADKGEKAQ